jgi:hypothetical protein
MRVLTLTPGPAPARRFKGGQNMWANSVFEALGGPFWPSPPAPLPHAGSRADRTCGQIRRLRRYNVCFGPHPRPRSRFGSGVTQAHACGIP